MENDTSDEPTRWVSVSRETFEYTMIPWVGREAAPWLRTSARPNPVDPTDLVLVPERVDRVFRADQQPFTQATEQQLRAMGYPRLPEDDELAAAESELESATRAGDWERTGRLGARVEQREARRNLARRAVDAWAHADAERLEEDVAAELSTPVADRRQVLVGIPAQLASGAGDAP